MNRNEIILFGLALLCLSLFITRNQPRGKIAGRLLEEFSIDAIKAGLFA
ncbi:MAG TPA: hypothetical protein VGG45_17990 [Terracidiphilus sp.]|jgi:hypothetical protein